VLSIPACISPHLDPQELARIDQRVADRTGTPFHSAEILASEPRPPEPAPTGTMTLERAQSIALSRNLALVASAENVAIAQAQLAAAGLLENPVFNMSLRWPMIGGLADVDLALSQALNGLWTRSTKVDVAEIRRFQSGLDLASQAFDVVGQVESKYRGLVHIVRTRELSARVAENYARALEAAEARAKVGVVPAPEVNRARVQLEDAQRKVRRFDAQYKRTARELHWLLGFSSTPEWTLPDDASRTPSELPAVPDPQLLERVGLKFRLDLQRASLDREVNRAQVHLARLGFIPQMSLGYDRERDETGAVKRGPTFSLVLPIFDPGFVAYELALAQLRQADKQYAVVEGQVRQDVSAAHSSVSLDIDDVGFYRDRIIPQQEETVRLAQESFRQGFTDLDSLLNTLRDYVSALQGYEDSLQGYYDDVVQFERAVGLVWSRIVDETRSLPSEEVKP
jgi:outer membrane protein TolC